MGINKRQIHSVGNTISVAISHFDEVTGVNYKGWWGIIRQIFPYEEVEDSDNLYGLIEWDFSKVTDEQLLHIRTLYQLEKEWSTQVLPLNWLEQSEASFPAIANEWQKNKIGDLLFWDDFPEHCDIIRTVFPNHDINHSKSPYTYWEQALNKELKFPVPAQVIYPYELDEGELQENDQIFVVGTAGWETPLGVFVEVKRNERSFILPLQDIEPLESNSSGAWIEAYQIWLECRA